MSIDKMILVEMYVDKVIVVEMSVDKKSDIYTQNEYKQNVNI
jgi:hypothetical protein